VTPTPSLSSFSPPVSIAGVLDQAQDVRFGAFRPQKGASPAETRKVAEDFEALFIGQMLKFAYAGVKVDPTFGGGHGEEMFRSVLLDEYGKSISRAGGVGIADQVYRELMRTQEVAK